jgi:hypothetical protein
MGCLTTVRIGFGRVGESVARGFFNFDLVVLFKRLKTGLVFSLWPTHSARETAREPEHLFYSNLKHGTCDRNAIPLIHASDATKQESRRS